MALENTNNSLYNHENLEKLYFGRDQLLIYLLAIKASSIADWGSFFIFFIPRASMKYFGESNYK